MVKVRYWRSLIRLQNWRDCQLIRPSIESFTGFERSLEYLYTVLEYLFWKSAKIFIPFFIFFLFVYKCTILSRVQNTEWYHIFGSGLKLGWDFKLVSCFWAWNQAQWLDRIDLKSFGFAQPGPQTAYLVVVHITCAIMIMVPYVVSNAWCDMLFWGRRTCY